MSGALLHGGKPLPGRLFEGPAGASAVVLIHEWWGVADWCTPKRIDALEQTLAGAKVTATLHRCDAGHAFFNDTRTKVYSAPDAALAWRRTLEFLRAALA